MMKYLVRFVLYSGIFLAASMTQSYAEGDPALGR